MRLHLKYCLAIVVFAAACSDGVGPQQQLAFDPAGTHESALSNLGGAGTGGVSVTPHAIPQAYFSADIKVRIHGAKPNTVYTVQRAPEIGRASGSDGVCQRALGIAPWSPSDPPAAAFVTFTQSDGTTPFTMTTTAAGDGTLDFSFTA